MGACKSHWQMLQPSRCTAEFGEVAVKPSSLVRVTSLPVHSNDPPRSQNYLSGGQYLFGKKMMF